MGVVCLKINVIYIPRVYCYDRGTSPPTTPSCLYYRWQRKLWDLFIKRTDFNFIWKAGPRSSNLEDPIKMLKASNIRYSTRKLSKELKKADIAIVDVASTPMMEAVLAGKKVICVIDQIDNEYVRWDAIYDLGESVIF